MRSIAVFVAAVASAAGCEQSRPPSSDVTSAAPGAGTAALVLIDSVVLAESDSIVLGTPNSLAVLPAGDFVVSDVASPKVVHYGRDGKPRRLLGRRGGGPGEFRAPSWLALAGGRTVLVRDGGGLKVIAYDVDSGSTQWEQRFPAQTSSMHVDGRRIYIGFVGGSKTGTLATVEFPSAAGTPLEVPTDIRAIGPVPALFSRFPMAASVFGTVELVAIGDTVASVYEVSNHVYLTSISTGAIDSIPMAPGKRRGARLDLLSSIVDQATATQAFLKSSIPYELARLSSGALAYVAFDADQTKTGISGRTYLVLIDPARRATCADTPIPGAEQPPVRVAFSADTLFTLSQEVVGADSAATVVRAYRVDTRGCAWR